MDKTDYRFIPFCVVNTAIECEETRKNANPCENEKLAKILKTIDFWAFRQFFECFLLTARS